jgi:DNA-binding GntR family transcriptional regulator
VLAAASYPERKEKEEHRAILDAFVAADGNQVIALLKKHYQVTVNIILEARFSPDLTIHNS